MDYVTFLLDLARTGDNSFEWKVTCDVKGEAIVVAIAIEEELSGTPRKKKLSEPRLAPRAPEADPVRSVPDEHTARESVQLKQRMRRIVGVAIVAARCSSRTVTASRSSRSAPPESS